VKSSAVFHPNTNVATSFVGKLSVADTSNGRAVTENAGLLASHDDWMRFAASHRAWGLQGASFPDAGNRGSCSSGLCQQWDFALRATDNVLRELFSAPSVFHTHYFFAADEAECDAINGATWDGALCTTEWLEHTREIFLDDIGNDNGFCEHGETCLLLPNYGAYQGEGSIVSAGVSGDVALVKYSTNGR
jgi:hypothetical protein